MLLNYLPILIFLIVASVFGVLLLVAGHVLGPNHSNPEKDSPYECGFESFEDARMKFNVRYYLVAIIFIIFDLEVVFLIPWAVSLDVIGMTGFWAMMVFLTLLAIGLIFEWRRGALEWD
jgi:NADH-quinone oxidoreductase subunit A